MAELESTVINTNIKQKNPSTALVIAVTTRAIFNLEAEHKLYLEKGKEEYTRHQQASQDKPLPPGTAFAFIQAVQYVNEKILESNPAERELFDILVLSNNRSESSVRIINSAKHYGVSAAFVFQQEVQAPSTPLRMVLTGMPCSSPMRPTRSSRSRAWRGQCSTSGQWRPSP